MLIFSSKISTAVHTFSVSPNRGKTQQEHTQQNVFLFFKKIPPVVSVTDLAAADFWYVSNTV